jgi:hypothetical protein
MKRNLFYLGLATCLLIGAVAQADIPLVAVMVLGATARSQSAWISIERETV